MFGLVIPGRAVLAPNQVDETSFALEVPLIDDIPLNHVAIFLTGIAPFPDGVGASIHVRLPGKDWQCIGGLSNSKPSAIFKLHNLGSVSSSSSFSTPTTLISSSSTPTVSIGFRCEPFSSIAAQLPPTSTALAIRNPPSASPTELAAQLVKHLYNTVASFAQPLPDGSGSWIDLRAFDVWYQKIITKIKNGGVGFLNED